MARIIFYTYSILLIVACDCHVVVEGKVFSNSTKMPIEGANVELIDQGETTKSANSGYFKLEKVTGFCFDPHIKITAEHYKPFEITFKGSNDTRSFELKHKSDFLEYDEPFYPDTNNKKTFTVGTSIEKYSNNFAFSGDTVLFYLDTINPKKEIEEIKANMREYERR